MFANDIHLELHEKLLNEISIYSKLSLALCYFEKYVIEKKEQALKSYENTNNKHRTQLEYDLRCNPIFDENTSYNNENNEKNEKNRINVYYEKLQKFDNDSKLARMNIETEIHSKYFCGEYPVQGFIPETIFRIHFHDYCLSIEYNYWFFNSRVENYFQIYLKNFDFEHKLKSPKALLYLKADLNLILDFEKKVEDLILNERITAKTRNNYYEEEIEYLRVLEDYYKYNVCTNIDKSAMIKAKYILMKDYLENEINKLNSKTNVSNEINNLTCNFTQSELECLLNQLIAGANPFFDSNNDKNSFLYAFGAIDSLEKFIPLVWVKTQEQKNTKEVNIRSFIDFLSLMEIDYSNPDNKKLIEKLFKKKNKNGEINSMKFQPRHFDIDSKTRHRKTSEFFDILQSMITKCKSNK